MGKRADATRVASDSENGGVGGAGAGAGAGALVLVVLVAVVVAVWVASLHKFRKYRVENRYPHRDYRWWLVGAA
ncbi:hypothetical protein M0802_007847 [Mischocyttarus mexicanus]|nr:hypothetical protein M0802_007847 [Mischocyttarus mexicanus]